MRVEAKLFAAALAARLLHLALYRSDFWLRTPLLDDNIFVAWSDVIARGGWLARELGSFDFNPAYPYVLAALVKTVGRAPELVFGLQHLIGALVPVLLYRLSARLFNARAAAVAGAIAALYGPAFFFESRYLGELPIYFLNCAFLLALAGTKDSRAPGLRWVVAGLCLGFSALFRPTALALAAPAACWCLASEPRWAVAPRFAAFLLAVWLPMLPFQLRNRVVDPAAGWGLTTASGGVNLFMGNNPESNGFNQPPSFASGGPGEQYKDFKAEAERRLARPLSAREVSRYWSGRALEFMRARPRDAARLVLLKIGYFWNHREPPDNFFIAIFERFTKLGPIPLLGWGLVAPLGLLGLLWSLPDWRRCWLLHAYVLCYLALNAAFLVLSRYRFPAAAGLIPAAGFALVSLHDLARAKRWAGGALAAAGLALVFGVSRLGTIAQEDMALTHYSMGVIYANQGWVDAAAEEYRKGIATNPRFAPSYLNLGLLEARRGNARAAIAALEAALGLESDPAQAQRLRSALAQLKSR